MALFLFGNYNSVEIRPNIIWLVAEDQSVNFFPMYGDETIDLPNLSSLREDGILYENAYSPVPVCAPARSSIITGMYPTSLGTHNMRTYAEFPQPKPSKDIINYSPVPISNVKMFTEYRKKITITHQIMERKIIILKKLMDPGIIPVLAVVVHKN